MYYMKLLSRIDIEVLSVVAQQISMIQKSISSGATMINCGDIDIKLNPTCAMFVTMVIDFDFLLTDCSK